MKDILIRISGIGILGFLLLGSIKTNANVVFEYDTLPYIYNTLEEENVIESTFITFLNTEIVPARVFNNQKGSYIKLDYVSGHCLNKDNSNLKLKGSIIFNEEVINIDKIIPQDTYGSLYLYSENTNISSISKDLKVECKFIDEL